LDINGFYEWERIISINYDILWSRSSPAQENRVAVDEMPEDLNWIAMVDKLAGGDITKHNQIYDINYVECLNLMAYWHHRDKHIEQINKAIAKKYNK
jgi:hypothetical protein